MRTRLVMLVMLALSAAACSSPSTSPVTTSPVHSVSSPVFDAIDDGTQVLRSDSDPDLYAAPCTGEPSLQLATGWTLASVPTGVALRDGAVALEPSTAVLTVDAAPVDGSAPPRPVRIRCLPEGFPRIEVDGRFSDWLMLTMMPTEPAGRPFQMILEPNGFPAWFRQVPGALADFYRVGDELVTFTPGQRPIASFSNVDGLGFRVEDFDGSITRQWIPVDGIGLDFHAVALLDNGNALVLRYELSTQPLDPIDGELPAQVQDNVEQCPARRPGSDSETLRGRIVEVTPAGDIVRSWRIDEHLPQAAISADWVNAAATGQAPRCVIDAEHLNALAFYPQAGSPPDHGQVLLTGRHIDGAVLLDWPSGQVRWTLGGRSNPLALRIVGDPLGGPVHPHDANFIGDDRVLIYDNRKGGETSRALVYRIDEAARTATLESSYTASCPAGPESPAQPCSAFAMGSSRPTLDGSGVLVGWGTATLTAAEFARIQEGSADTPRATLRLVDSWAYRVLPAAPFVLDALVQAQDRLGPLR